MGPGRPERHPRCQLGLAQLLIAIGSNSVSVYLRVGKRVHKAEWSNAKKAPARA
jgi:hypothetical protein